MYSRRVFAGTDARKEFREVTKFARRHDIPKTAILTTYYRKPYRRRLERLSAEGYWPKWGFVKYCNDVAKFSNKNKLFFSLPLRPEDEMRPASLSPTEPATIESLSQRLAEIVRSATELEGHIRAMPLSEASNDKKLTNSLRQHTLRSGEDIFDTYINKKKGKLPRWPMFLTDMEGSNWPKMERQLVYTRLKRYIALRLEGQMVLQKIERIRVREREATAHQPWLIGMSHNDLLNAANDFKNRYLR